MKSSISKLFKPEIVAGLTRVEAAKRLRESGPNEIPSARHRSVIKILWEAASEPMILLLLACGGIYLALGDPHESVLLLGFVFIVIAMTFYETHRTERALEALRNLSSPRALVIRDGVQLRIPGREVVCGDIVFLAEGDRVPADGAVIQGAHITMDESLLTGESLPVSKTIWDGVRTLTSPAGEQSPFAYSGTLVVSGQGVMRVLATGADTALGKIGHALQQIPPERTLLQTEVRHMVRIVAMIGIVVCTIVTLVYGIARHDWLTAILAGLVLAMSILPEEFPVVLTIFHALGAWRLSKHNALTRRMPAVEALGATTVLCVDKTGTLTMNQMSVSQLYTHDRHYLVGDLENPETAEELHELLEFSVLASQRDPFDPMEKGIRKLGETALARTEHWHEDWQLVDAYPLSPQLLAMSHVWQSRSSEGYAIAAKGSPEAIGDLCHFDAARLETLEKAVSVMASRGLRVIAVAKADFRAGNLPEIQHDFDFVFIGLIGLGDPLRPTVPDSIKECQDAGIRVMMITGDHGSTALEIARQAGFPKGGIITGPELDGLGDEELKERIHSINIFARVVPEQKLRIVTALKSAGEIVAMTGDGVNDAPALRAAHIGIAMGGRGTDVAREAASIVLLDDDFSTIVNAIRLGRRIFTNLRQAMIYIIASHIPIAGLTLIPILLGWPLPLLPAHIVFLELIINPACSVVFEAEHPEKDIMKRSPRKHDETLFGLNNVTLAILQGLIAMGLALLEFGLALNAGFMETEARALTFITLIVANLGLILANRSATENIAHLLLKRNRAFWWVSLGAMAFLALALKLPLAQGVFHFSALSGANIIIGISVGFSGILCFEILKFFRNRNS